MYLIKTILAHPEYIQIRVMQEITNLHNDTDLRLDIKGTCSNPEDLYQMILTHKPDLILMDASLLTPCINVAAGFCDIVAITENRAMSDSGNIHYSFVPVQPPELLERIFSIYKNYSDTDLKQREKTKIQYIENLKLPAAYCSTIDSTCLQEHLLIANGVPPLTQRNVLCSMIENGTLPLERVKIRHPGTQFDPRSMFNPQLSRIIGEVEDVDPIPIQKRSVQDGKAPRLVRLEWAKKPQKTNYHRGEPFDFRDGIIRAWYSDATHKEISVQDNMISYHGSLDTPSTKTINIGIKGRNLPLQINILQPSLNELRLEQVGRTNYLAGEVFQPAGYVIVAVFSDGTSEQIPFFKYPKKPLEVGVDTIILSYGKFELPIQIRVKTGEGPIPIQELNSENHVIPYQEQPHLEFLKEPSKTSYLSGETISKDQLLVKLVQPDGSFELIQDFDLSPNRPLIEEDCEANISYKGLSLSYKIQVSNKILVAAVISSMPKKLDYVLGTEQMDPSGGKLSLFYTDSSSEEIQITTDMISGFDGSKVGNQVIYVEYQKNRLPIKVSVQDRKLVKVEVLNPPLKTDYTAGEFLDITGLLLKAIYDNGDTVEISNYQLKEQIRIEPEQAVVKLDYCGGIFPVFIHVSNAKLVKIEMEKLPDKLSYLEHRDMLKTDGGIVAKCFNNGERKLIPLELKMTSGFSNQKIGPCRICVMVDNMQCFFEVDIVGRQVSKISVVHPPQKTLYFEQESFDSTGMEIKAQYDNQTFERIEEYEISPKILSSADTYVTVSYHNKTVTVPIQVQMRMIESISIARMPNKSRFKEGRDALDVSGGRLLVLYNNGSADTIDMTEDMIEGFDNMSPGDDLLTVRYQDASTQYRVIIEPKVLIGIAVTTPPNQVVYQVGEYFAPDGMVVLGFYDNGKSAPANHFSCQPDRPLTMEDTVISVSYMDKMAFVPIEVVEELVSEPTSPIDVVEDPQEEPSEIVTEEFVSETEDALLSEPEQEEPIILNSESEQMFEEKVKPVIVPHFYPNTQNLRFKEPNSMF